MDARHSPLPPSRERARDGTPPGVGEQDLGDLPLTGVIRNVRSHRNKGLPQGLADHPNVHVVQPANKDEIETALIDFAARGIELLAISGGDGTVRDVLTRGASVFGTQWPPIIVLPKGKTNALSVDLGLPRRWRLADAVAAATRGKTVTRRPLVVMDLDGTERDRWGFILGTGVFPTAIESGQAAHRAGAFQSFAVGVAVVMGLAQAFFGTGTSKWRRLYATSISHSTTGIDVPHSKYGKKARRYIALFSTFQNLPLGIKPFPVDRQGKPIAYFLVDAPLRRVLLLAPAALMGLSSRLTRKLGIHKGVGERFQIELADDYVLDGEAYPAGRYRLAAGPELRFIVP